MIQRTLLPDKKWIFHPSELLGTASFVLYPVVFTKYFYIMKLYEAINRMRQLTAEGKSFSMSFMSFNSTEMKSEGVVDVSQAKLRKKADAGRYKNADFLMPYQDLDKGEARQFYLPLLMSFNGEKITIR